MVQDIINKIKEIEQKIFEIKSTATLKTAAGAHAREIELIKQKQELLDQYLNILSDTIFYIVLQGNNIQSFVNIIKNKFPNIPIYQFDFIIEDIAQKAYTINGKHILNIHSLDVIFTQIHKILNQYNITDCQSKIALAVNNIGNINREVKTHTMYNFVQYILNNYVTNDLLLKLLQKTALDSAYDKKFTKSVYPFFVYNIDNIYLNKLNNVTSKILTYDIDANITDEDILQLLKDIKNKISEKLSQ